MVRQPWIVAICPSAEPAASVAFYTTTVSPCFGCPIIERAVLAVAPLIPRIPREVDNGRSGSAILRTTAEGATTAYSCQPNQPVTGSPGEKPGARDSITEIGRASCRERVCQSV